MAIDRTLLEMARAALSGVPNVEEQKMFGGIAFMVDGKMCITVGRDRMMFRIDPQKHLAALKRPGASGMAMNGRVYRGFVRVDADTVSSKRELNYWVRLALEYNPQIPARRKR
jgi:TfoX/Sxy family transcriptional regulator of competence genes